MALLSAVLAFALAAAAVGSIPPSGCPVNNMCVGCPDHCLSDGSCGIWSDPNSISCDFGSSPCHAGFTWVQSWAIADACYGCGLCVKTTAITNYLATYPNVPDFHSPYPPAWLYGSCFAVDASGNCIYDDVWGADLPNGGNALALTDPELYGTPLAEATSYRYARTSVGCSTNPNFFAGAPATGLTYGTLLSTAVYVSNYGPGGLFKPTYIDVLVKLAPGESEGVLPPLTVAFYHDSGHYDPASLISLPYNVKNYTVLYGGSLSKSAFTWVSLNVADSGLHSSDEWYWIAISPTYASVVPTGSATGIQWGGAVVPNNWGTTYSAVEIGSAGSATDEAHGCASPDALHFLHSATNWRNDIPPYGTASDDTNGWGHAEAFYYDESKPLIAHGVVVRGYEIFTGCRRELSAAVATNKTAPSDGIWTDDKLPPARARAAQAAAAARKNSVPGVWKKDAAGAWAKAPPRKLNGC